MIVPLNWIGANIARMQYEVIGEGQRVNCRYQPLSRHFRMRQGRRYFGRMESGIRADVRVTDVEEGQHEAILSNAP